jgi:nitrogen fixation protein
MYRSCIFCSARLGANESIEHFPVGKTLAFDAAKGRLWAVCPKCTRWNLAPIEERWEAIEEAERLFRDARLRAQSENVGLTKLRDGTRLIRVGKALRGELALWRYGAGLLRRRRLDLSMRALGYVGYAAWMFGPIGGAVGGLTVLGYGVRELSRKWSGSRLMANLSATEAGDGKPARIKRKHIIGATLGEGHDGGLRLKLTGIERKEAGQEPDESGFFFKETRRDVVLQGAAAVRVLARGMTFLNARGAPRSTLDEAVSAIARAEKAGGYVRRAAGWGMVLGETPRDPAEPVALEMALHEEQERRAMDGELAELEAMWREAEEIAAITDALPDLPKPDSVVSRKA